VCLELRAKFVVRISFTHILQGQSLYLGNKIGVADYDSTIPQQLDIYDISSCIIDDIRGEDVPIQFYHTLNGRASVIHLPAWKYINISFCSVLFPYKSSSEPCSLWSGDRHVPHAVYGVETGLNRTHFGGRVH
jgi:hypothetical protein